MQSAECRVLPPSRAERAGIGGSAPVKVDASRGRTSVQCDVRIHAVLSDLLRDRLNVSLFLNRAGCWAGTAIQAMSSSGVDFGARVKWVMVFQ